MLLKGVVAAEASITVGAVEARSMGRRLTEMLLKSCFVPESGVTIETRLLLQLPSLCSHFKAATMSFQLPTGARPASRVTLGGEIATAIRQFGRLIKERDGDQLSESSFEGYAWSALRILRIVQMESVDDDEIRVMTEASVRIVTLISGWLSVSDMQILSNPSRHSHRLCPCRRQVELGWLALSLGKLFGVPLRHGQYSGTGPTTLSFFRTFYLSAEMPHLVVLEFEIASKRAEQTERDGPISKIVVNLDDELVSLETDIESKEIIAEEEGDDDCQESLEPP